ncbi:NADH-quinone oxidoreductase subunit C [Acidobacteriota bacterium]
MEKKNIVDALKNEFPDKVKEIVDPTGDIVFTFESEALLEIVQFLRKKPFEYAMLLDLTCVDYKGESPRFEMVYHFLSLISNTRIRLKTRLPEKGPKIESLASIWRNANWLEREVFDMFGIHFDNHPYLRRLFMWDGFEGYPLRKEYPLRKRQIHPRLSKQK